MVALFIGSAIGVPLALLMPMTAVPQRTAISQACGALASALIGTAEYYRLHPQRFPRDGGAGRRNAARAF